MLPDGRRALSPVARYEELGAEGFHSLFRWYQRFEAQQFPDPAGLRAAVARATFGAYPGAVRAAMALFDIPEAIAVTRTAMCAAGGVAVLPRLQVFAILQTLTLTPFPLSPRIS